jgi:hypothetical protein
MKRRLPLLAALVVASGLCALPSQAQEFYVLRGKVVSAAFYKMLVVHCPTSKTFFKEHWYECGAVRQQAVKRRRLPNDWYVEEAALLKMLQNRDGVLRESSGGSRQMPEPVRQGPNDPGFAGGKF